MTYKVDWNLPSMWSYTGFKGRVNAEQTPSKRRTNAEHPFCSALVRLLFDFHQALTRRL